MINAFLADTDCIQALNGSVSSIKSNQVHMPFAVHDVRPAQLHASDIFSITQLNNSSLTDSDRQGTLHCPASRSLAKSASAQKPFGPDTVLVPPAADSLLWPSPAW